MSDPYRTPGRVDPPPDSWLCPHCKRYFHIAANARRISATEVVCMSCYEERGRQKSR